MPRIRSNVFRHSRSLMMYSPSRGNVCSHENAAAGPGRQPVDMLVLRQIRPHAVNGRARGDVEVADRQPADVPRRPTGTAPSATARPSGRPRCCRTRCSHRRAAGARPRRCRAPAGPGWRWRTRPGSDDGWTSARDVVSRPPPDRETVSRYPARSSSWARAGRGIPGGGIIPARSFRITFSQVSAPLGTSVRSACSSDSPPVRLLSLWHVTQYLPTTAACGEEAEDSIGS